ncbi:MAG: imidazolonepropionase [Candidatus Cloacimonetes bacterium]|nr:imidazolonepropionase [Candidatus Cloacimonadota bacterium]
MKIDLIIHNACQIATVGGSPGPRKGDQMQDVGIIHNAALAIHQGKVLACASNNTILQKYHAAELIDAEGALITPGFVDPHTHPVFVHTREDEFAMRIAGATYVQIAQAGGGIRSTIASTRDADHELLFTLAKQRIRRMIQQGTTTLEAKSGYGLDTASELKQLEVIKALAEDLPIDIVPTFMGAHEYPAEYKNDHEAYLKILTQEMIPAVQKQGIARFCDIFTEAHVYDISESRRVLSCAREHGMQLKMHADEIEPMGGAELAAEMGCISADHLGAATDAGILAMKEAGVIPVLLPATLFSLRSKTYARARFMIEKGLPVAIATDYNPGSCNCDSMPLTMSLACLQMGMSPEEALTAATINAAYSIGMGERKGSLEPGKDADLILWDIPSLNFIPYHLGSSHIQCVYAKGRLVYRTT